MKEKYTEKALEKRVAERKARSSGERIRNGSARPVTGCETSNDNNNIHMRLCLLAYCFRNNENS